MNDNAKKWVAALRSGEYEQGFGVLTDLHSTSLVRRFRHCCLGVACELALEAGVPLEVEDANGVRYYDDNVTFLPSSVQAWLGLCTVNGTFGESLNSLSSCNDHGRSFEAIADIIEYEPEGLFA